MDNNIATIYPLILPHSLAVFELVISNKDIPHIGLNRLAIYNHQRFKMFDKIYKDHGCITNDILKRVHIGQHT